MKLAFCIPTHHGRANYLRELLDSIANQTGLPDGLQTEICISDNASEDGTSEMLDLYQRTCPIPIKYFRFPQDMRGVRNQTNVIEMADADYCWLLGSDDIILPGGVSRVSKYLEGHPKVIGVTVNKINYDKTLQHKLGPDHPIVLPRKPQESRILETASDAIVAFGMLFSYMSAHIFRRSAWQGVVKKFGMDHLKTMRHFSHTFIFLQIVKDNGMWFWCSEHSVVQRMGNFCVMEEKDGRGSLYSMELLEDLERVWASVAQPTSMEFTSLMRRQFLCFWHPFAVRRFKLERLLTPEEDRAMTVLACRCFRRVPLFYLTSFPILYTPMTIIRASTLIDHVLGYLRTHQVGIRPLVRLALWLFGIQNGWTRQFDEKRAEVRIATTRNKAEKNIYTAVPQAVGETMAGTSSRKNA